MWLLKKCDAPAQASLTVPGAARDHALSLCSRQSYRATLSTKCAPSRPPSPKTSLSCPVPFVAAPVGWEAPSHGWDGVKRIALLAHHPLGCTQQQLSSSVPVLVSVRAGSPATPGSGSSQGSCLPAAPRNRQEGDRDGDGDGGQHPAQKGWIIRYKHTPCRRAGKTQLPGHHPPPKKPKTRG